jgi:hypothetical protein
MTRTVKTTTATDAPADISGIAANCAAPAKTITDMASVSRAESPLPIAVAPKATPKGIRASKTGTMAFAPETNAALEDTVFGSSLMVPSRTWAMLLGRISSFNRGFWSQLLPE